MSNSASLKGGATLFLTTGTRVAADQLGAVFEVLHAADLHADRGVELEGAAAGRDLRVAVDDADLFAQLVDEDRDALALCDRTGELAHRLAHHAGVQADEGVAHFALDLGTGGQRRDRVDNDDVDRARAHERLRDVEALLTGVRLRNQQAVDVNAERLGVDRVERVLRVDECRRAAELLRLCYAVQSDRGLTGGLRSVNLDDTAARQAADAEREVEADRAGRDVLDRHAGVFTEAHDRALAELLFDLAERVGERFLFVRCRCNRLKLLFRSHKLASSMEKRGACPSRFSIRPL